MNDIKWILAGWFFLSYINFLTLSGLAFSVVRQARGGSEAQMPKIKVNINQLKWNLAWVITVIKAFLMQNLSLIALPVLEIWVTKFPSEEGNESWNSAIYPRKTGLTLKKMSFYVQNRSSRPKIDPPCQFQQFSSIGKIFQFQNFWDVSMRKEQQQPPWLTNFAKMWPKGVSRIKTKSHQVWAS